MKRLFAFFRHVYTPHLMTLPEAVFALAAEIPLHNSFTVQKIIWRHGNDSVLRSFHISTFREREIVSHLDGQNLEELVIQAIREYSRAV